MNPKQLGAQLYTTRDLCTTPAETADVIAAIGKIGYAAVEIAGICEIPAPELRKMTSDAGVMILSMHGNVEHVIDEPQRVVDQANEMGCGYVVTSNPADLDFSKQEAMVGLAKKLAQAGEVYRNAGITFCYHNHSREFIRYGDRTGLDILIDSISPDLVEFELDTYWAQHGGCNPVTWCERLQGRLPILHCKDYIVSTERLPTMTEVGNGNLEWPQILSAAERSGCKWFIVEQDICPGNPIDSLKASFDYLRAKFFQD